MSTCVYSQDLHTDIYTPKDVADALRKAADELVAQYDTVVSIHIAGIEIILDADIEEIFVIA